MFSQSLSGVRKETDRHLILFLSNFGHQQPAGSRSTSIYISAIIFLPSSPLNPSVLSDPPGGLGEQDPDRGLAVSPNPRESLRARAGLGWLGLAPPPSFLRGDDCRSF